jgi:hypothetical protein
MARLALAGAAALLLIVLGLDAAGFSYVEVLKDPNNTAGQPWWTGGVSLVGLLCWGAVAALFSSAAWIRREVGAAPESWRFLASGAALFVVAGVDDALMLHDGGLSRDSQAAEYGIYGLYAAAAAVWMLRFRDELRLRPLLLVSLACFAVSAVLDAVLDASDSTSVWALPEDYLKYVGLGTLLLSGIRELDAAVRQGPAADRGQAAGPRTTGDGRPSPGEQPVRRGA